MAERRSGLPRTVVATMQPCDEKRRPAGDRATAQPTSRATDDCIVTTSSRRRWARALIDRAAGREIPSYGSPEWCALPDTSPLRVAGCVVAAEAWAQSGDELATRLREELRARAQAEEDAEYIAGIAEHRKRWRHLSVVTDMQKANRPPYTPPTDGGRDGRAGV